MRSFSHIALALTTLAVLGSTAAEPQPATPSTQPRPESRRGMPRQWPKAEWLDPDHTTPNGTQYKTFNSKVLDHDVSYLVWLPEGYESGTKRYPVLYWLHGMGGNQRGGAQMFLPHMQAAIKQGVMPPAIVVFVNGMVKGFYLDAVSGKQPMESVIIKDLVPHIDSTYRTLATREGRMIEGYSMGGYGAAHLGFKYPEVFGTVVVNAGALMTFNGPIPEGGPMYDIVGNDTKRRELEHPLHLARQNADKLRKTHIRIGCGGKDSLLRFNQQLHELLGELGIEHQYEVVPEVAHNAALYYTKLGTKVFEFHQNSLGAKSEAASK